MLGISFFAAIVGRIYIRRQHYKKEANNIAKAIACVPPLYLRSQDLPYLYSPHSTNIMENLNETINNSNQRKEIIVIGKPGQGTTHSVVNVAIQLQEAKTHKCLLVDLNKAFSDFCTAKAADVAKIIFPSNNLIDMISNFV